MGMMERRTFLKRAVAGVSGIVAAIVGLPAIRYLLDPLTRSRQAGTFVRLLPLSALPPGQPTLVSINADRTDAYTHYPPGTIGQVFLTRPDSNREAVQCLQVICPHLGCAIDYLPDRGSFACPCHASDFGIDGRRRAGPSPRDMDSLECRLSDPDAAGERWVEVKYQEFEAGISDRVAKS
jgi:Rieske Fe-S protein